jgi:tRNA dimethylallyltransferase
MTDPLLVAVMGPTASGKTDLAERIADALDAQLINADAFQVYRGLDVGTAKSAARDRYLLMDVREPAEGFGVGEFVLLAAEALQRLYRERRHAVLVGGTGLYVRALFEEYAQMAPPPDPALRERLMEREVAEGLESLARELREKDPDVASKTDLRNPARVRRALERIGAGDDRMQVSIPPFQKLKFGLTPTMETLVPRIAERARDMVQNGWVQETRRLLDEGHSPDEPGFRAHGYRAMARVVRGEMELEEALEKTIAEIRRYAKRQLTWLRSEPYLIRLDPDVDPFAQAMDHIQMKLS